MAQPIKNRDSVNKKGGKTIKRSRKGRTKKTPVVNMNPPVDRKRVTTAEMELASITRRTTTKSSDKMKKKLVENAEKDKQQYGTSKLEEKFASDFLDRLGISYTYQYEMKPIGRFLDFMCNDNNQSTIAIEIQGDYWHGFGLLYEDMSPVQKRSYRIGEIKKRWCFEHCIPLYEIWEHDINNHPQKVMNMLKRIFGIKSLVKKKGRPQKKKKTT